VQSKLDLDDGHFQALFITNPSSNFFLGGTEDAGFADAAAWSSLISLVPRLMMGGVGTALYHV
jgi:hypothetical protein